VAGAAVRGNSIYLAGMPGVQPAPPNGAK
jgi:hypothetical protein